MLVLGGFSIHSLQLLVREIKILVPASARTAKNLPGQQQTVYDCQANYHRTALACVAKLLLYRYILP